ncbi:Serine/Threonine protein kinase, FIKK family, putative [Plasmodium malariae]|uniref:Serine/Threonine protein kinase, FIKK family, putative n=1 Tax=Plasmodium malariae TaxID=5858 RepID=A0A1C3KLA7_PLAMA|nr:Serine/Threonine protein kinase, FIKK family, putative [Plasmodium malariae]
MKQNSCRSTSDGASEFVRRGSSKLSTRKDSDIHRSDGNDGNTDEVVEIDPIDEVYHVDNCNNDCGYLVEGSGNIDDNYSVEMVKYGKRQQSDGKTENNFDMNSKGTIYTKKENFKSMESHQDIFNDMENVNDSTTECTSSVKDMQKFRVNYSSSIHENNINKKICSAKDSEDIINIKELHTANNGMNNDISNGSSNNYISNHNNSNNSNDADVLNASSTRVHNATNKMGVCSSNQNFMVTENYIPITIQEEQDEYEENEGNTFEIYENETNKEYFPKSSNKPIYVNNANKNANKCSNVDVNAGVNVSTSTSGSVSRIVSDYKPNHNLSRNDSIKGGKGISPREILYKKKGFYLNKETDSIKKKKNETTLKKNYFHECIKNEKEKSMEEYFHNNNNNNSNNNYSNKTFKEKVLKNVKYENPSNTFNDIINSNAHYDLTSHLKSKLCYATARGRNIGREVDMEVAKVNVSVKNKEGKGSYYLQNEKLDGCEEAHIVHKSYNRNSNYSSNNYNAGICNVSSYNVSGYNNCGTYYNNNENDQEMTKNARMYYDSEMNFTQGKRYYLLPPKKNDVIKEQKNQMLMISKQKIKKIWNKFKNNSPKEHQTLVPTFESEQNLFPNMEVLHAQKIQVHNNDYYNDRGGICMNNNNNSNNSSTTCNNNNNSNYISNCNNVGSSLINNNYANIMSKENVNKSIRWNNNNNLEKQIKSKCIFNWKVAQKSLFKMLHSAHNFYFNGVKYSDWELTCIPTLGFSKSSNRVQQMFKAVVPSKDGNSRNDVKLFIKKVPIYIWVKQFNLMNEYEGEYVTDGENFVMEATSLAFLNEYHPGITPKLYKILYETDNSGKSNGSSGSNKNNNNNNNDNNNNTNNNSSNIVSSNNVRSNNASGNNNKHQNECNIPPKSMFNNLTLFNEILTDRLKCNINGNIVIVSEFFSEDILDFIDRRQKKYNMKISNNEKSYILYQCLKLLIRLHDAGLSHLDLTPENILISDNYEMRLCDLSKSTPIYTYNLRHVKDVNRLYLFESCEPTIAKGAYMPPECWKIYWKYDTMKIKNPLKDLKAITDQEKRKQFYFDVSSADKFMLGVFFFWIWTNGNLWKCSDPLQDEDFFYFVKCDMNFDKFELTRKWPNELKSIIKQLLHIEHRKKLNLKDLSLHPWWSCTL